MTNPTKGELQAINRLFRERSVDFVVFLGWLKRSRESLDDASLMMEGQDLFRNRGRALNIKNILNEVSGASDALERIGKG